MPFTLTMPKLSPTMVEGTIAKWFVKEGEFIEAGQLLMEVATDKATVEYNAIDEGYLRKLLVSEGDEAHVNQPIAIFTAEEKEEIKDYTPEGEAPKKEAPEPAEEKKKAATKKREPEQEAAMAQPRFEPAPPPEHYSFSPLPAEQGRIKASPLARKLAEERGLDLSIVKGSGPGGRIVEKDLEKAQPAGEFAFGKREMPTTFPGSFTEEKLTPMRRAISRRLQEAKTFIPHFYVTQTIDAEPLVELRQQLRNLELKVTYNDFVVRGAALALRKHPGVNSGFDNVKNGLIRFETIDVSVAVTLESGLITPIVRHADFKNLGEISSEMRLLARRAREGELQEEEYRGGSFTVSNLGMYGVTEFAAILNPPQAAILAVSGIREVPVVKNGRVVPGKSLNLTLSADHRVVDGVMAAEFLNTVKKYLENPASTLL